MKKFAGMWISLVLLAMISLYIIITVSKTYKPGKANINSQLGPNIHSNAISSEKPNQAPDTGAISENEPVQAPSVDVNPVREPDQTFTANVRPSKKPSQTPFVIRTFTSDPNASTDWSLAWCDEFIREEINENYWTLQTGSNIWGNNELQYYTNRPENCSIVDGKLIIRALREDYKGSRYTSARITSKNKIDFLYGRIEIKAKLPIGKGLLPAFWLLPAQDTYGDRKRNGEIDIMEMLGDKPNAIYGVAHFSFNGKYSSYGKYLNKNSNFTRDYYIYSLEWSPNTLKWYINDKLFYTLNLKKSFSNDYNPFTKNFFLVLNLAVGGDWPGAPTDDSIFPASLEIDYVRYYNRTNKN